MFSQDTQSVVRALRPLVRAAGLAPSDGAMAAAVRTVFQTDLRIDSFFRGEAPPPAPPSPTSPSPSPTSSSDPAGPLPDLPPDPLHADVGETSTGRGAGENASVSTRYGKWQRLRVEEPEWLQLLEAEGGSALRRFGYMPSNEGPLQAQAG